MNQVLEMQWIIPLPSTVTSGDRQNVEGLGKDPLCVKPIVRFGASKLK